MNLSSQPAIFIIVCGIQTGSAREEKWNLDKILKCNFSVNVTTKNVLNPQAQW